MKRFVGILICLGLMAGESRADDGQVAEPSRVETRKYDIRPLLKNARTGHAPDPGIKPRRASDPVGVGIPTRTELVDQLETLVMEMVAPNSWKSNGGTVGNIREEDGFLVVDQMPEAHEHVSYVVNKLVRPGAKSVEPPAQDGISVRFYDVRAVRVGATGVKLGDGRTTTHYESLEALTQRIHNECAPTTWRDKGGTIGMLRGIGGVLVVRQTGEVHQQIANLIGNASKK